MQIDLGTAHDDGRVATAMDDLVRPPDRSDWGRRVTDERIRTSDRIRPFVTRGLLLVGMAVALAILPDVSGWAWALLLPGAVQTVLEILLEDNVRAKAQAQAERSDRALRPLIAFWYRMYERLPFNATGLLGTVSVVAVLMMAVFATGPLNPAPGKIALFVLAVLCSVSGILGTMLDTPWFSPLAKMPVLVLRAYPFFWILATLIALALVLVGQLAGHWPDGALPYALIVCGLGYYVGLRPRDYQRDLRAAGIVMTGTNKQEQEDLAIELHNRLQPAKEGLRRVIDTADLAVAERVELRTFVADIEELYEESRTRQVDVASLLSRSYGHRVRKILDGTGITYAGSSFGLDGLLDSSNQRLARNLLTNLVYNASQAFSRDPFREDGRIVVTMSLEGDTATVSVWDSLEPIPADAFARFGSTLGYLATRVRHHGGDLVQVIGSQGAGKTISGSWTVGFKPLRETNE